MSPVGEFPALSRLRVIFTSGRRGDHSTLYFLDPRTDRISGSRDVAALKLDGPIMLGNGNFNRAHMDFTPPSARKADPVFHPNTFTVMTFKAQTP